MSIELIRPYPQNAKKHPQKQIDALVANIKEFGWRQPIVVDKDGIIIIGHARYEAAKQMEAGSVPVWRADELPPEKVASLRIADNRLGEMGKWDLDLLHSELNLMTPEMKKLAGFADLKLDDAQEPEFDENTQDEKLNTFLTNTVKQIVLYFKDDAYETTVIKLDKLQEEMGVDNNTDVFLNLMKFYEDAHRDSQ